MGHESKFELENYLEQLRTKGNLDSEGVFTVSGLRAVGKLAAFLLPKESDWILKIVQGAVASGASELHVDQSRTATQVRFRVPYLVNAGAFAHHLISTASSPSEPGLDDLISGLRAVGVGQLRDWVARISIPGKFALVSCSGGNVSAQEIENLGEQTETSEITLGVAYPPGQSGKLGGLIRFGEAIQNEHMTLLAKTRACPIPFYLDGRRIDDLFETSLPFVLQKRAFLGVNTPSATSADFLTVPGALQTSEGFRVQDKFSAHFPFMLSNTPVHRQAASLQRWFFNYTQDAGGPNKVDFDFKAVACPSKVHLVRRGVTVGLKNLGFSHAISTDIFLSAEHLRTDLTGLRVDPSDSEVEAAKEQIRESREFLNALINELSEHTSRPMRRELMIYGGLGALGLMMPLFALKALAGTVSTLMLARSAHNHGKIVKSAIFSLEDFQELIDSYKMRG